LSFDDFGIGRWLGEQAVWGVVLWSSQDMTFSVGEGAVVRS